MATSFSLSGTGGGVSISQSFTTGAANGAASDVAAIQALMAVVDQIVNDWLVQYRASGSTFNSQGGGAGSMAGRDSASAALALIRPVEQSLRSLGARSPS